MIRSSRYYYENRLALTMSNSPKPFFAYVRRRRELRMDVVHVIVKGVEFSPPAELCEVFRSYFSSTFRNDEGNYPQLNHSAISRMQRFTISAEDVHRQLINLNPRKSEGADEMYPRILISLAHYLTRENLLTSYT